MKHAGTPIAIRDVSKRFNQTLAVDHVTLEIAAGELFFLLGPSGCGKTTLLRILAGFVQPDQGSIHFGAQDITNLPPRARDAGMVFQSYALWPHMSVGKNVAYGLSVRGMAVAEIKQRVDQALKMVRMEGFGDRRPNELSGGQQQRVALARAIASEPAVLLLDEPLSNLDARLREDMRHEIKTLVRRLDTTTLYVTQDQLEALSMSDRVALVNDGVIVQEGAPRDVYLRPADAFVANFLGRTNLVDGRIADVDAGTVETRWGILRCGLPRSAETGSVVTGGFRPESVVLSEGTSRTEDGLRGKIASASFVGDAVEYQIDLGGRTVRAKGQPFVVLDEGRDVLVRVPPERCYVL